MAKNFYEEFASIYDEMMEDIDYEQVSAFITKRIENDCSNLLEVACGTGNVTEHLVYEDFYITAFDLSEEMLIGAVNKMRRFKNVEFHTADMIDFDFKQKYDACCCCCDGMNYINRDNLNKFFNNVYTHLEDEGWFIFDVSSEYKYRSMDKSYVYDKDNVFYVWENEIDEEKINMEINFFCQSNESKSDDKYKRITEFQTHYLHTNENIIADLKKIGFINIESFDGYTENELTEKSIRSTFVCRKA